MRVWAYCALSMARSVRRGAGIAPVTCPPEGAETIDIAQLAGRDLLWFDLHGRPGEGAWYGDDWKLALTEAQIRTAHLGGAGVFAANCYAGDPGAPMVEALLAAGAGWVIAGPGPNWAGQVQVSGATQLGRWIRRALMLGAGPEKALGYAKICISLAIQAMHDEAQRMAIVDTLGFRLIWRRGDGLRDAG